MQTVLRLYYIMMDPAADDLVLTASIGRSPRNDPEPPGPHHADYHGLPLDNATVPASTEARTRQRTLQGIDCLWELAWRAINRLSKSFGEVNRPLPGYADTRVSSIELTYCLLCLSLHLTTAYDI